MLNCTIQYLEQTKDGWHIRFSGNNDDFWLMLSKFKAEQKISGKFSCYYNPRLFGKGGWFCNEDVLIKYAGDFINYAEMRRSAEREWKLKNEYKQETWWGDQEEYYDPQKEKEKQQQKQREREQREYKPPTRVDTSLTITQALSLLELPAPASRLTEKQVKTAFHLKALKAHPDVGGSHDAMVQLNKAYQLVLIYCQKAYVG